MPLPTTCPHCRTAHRLADDLDGRLIRCKSCGEPFRVGGDRPDDEYDDEPRPRRRWASSTSSTLVPLLIVAGVVGVGVLVAGAGAVWYLMRSKPGARPVATKAGRNVVVPRHMLMPPRPAAGAAADGPEVVVLSNPRKMSDITPDRPTYQVDYQFTGAPALGHDWYVVVVKVPAGLSEAQLFSPNRNPNGTISFAFPPGHNPGGGFEMWVERRPFGKADERTRVSKVVTVD
jgi:predicted Zn finger-like uncharacterized protein